MSKDLVYICSTRNGKDFLVLEITHRMSSGRICTYLLEKIFRGTDWIVFSLNSLEFLGGNISWIFTAEEEYYDYLRLQIKSDL